MVRKKIELLEEFRIEVEAPETAGLTDVLDEQTLTDFIDEFKDEGFGYNYEVIGKGNMLKTLVGTDKTFGVDYDTYLKSFDEETKSLLGVDRGKDKEKFLEISGISGQLMKKNILMASVKEWAEIELKVGLTPYYEKDYEIIAYSRYEAETNAILLTLWRNISLVCLFIWIIRLV